MFIDADGQRASFDRDSVTIAGITLRGDGIGDAFRDHISSLQREILAVHGPRAFESPKRAAAIHEAGHVVVHAARGGRIRWAYIKNNDGAWVGFTEYRGAEYTLNPETDTSAKLLPIARDHCAGVTAERLFDAADFRHGSSLDELAVSQWMAAQAAFIDAVDAEGYWEKNVSDHVCKTLDKHRDVHADIAAHLMKHKQIKGAPLAEYILRIRAV